MKGLLIILFFLISFSASSQTDIKSQIGRTKQEVMLFMQSSTVYHLEADTVHIDIGELLYYKLHSYNDSTILANRVLNLTFFFEKGKCDGIRFILYGSDSMLQLIERLDKSFRRVGVNVWVDNDVKVGVRIIQLETYYSNNASIELFQIDMTDLDIFKN